MLKKKNNNIYFSRRSKYLLLLLSATIIVLLLVMQFFIQTWSNRKQAARTAEVLIDQVINVMETNESKQKTLTDSLKEDYITRAKAVSYLLDHSKWLCNNVLELQRIAKLISVDEIHVLTPEGAIYSGTVPKYFGYSFDSGVQMAYFKPMLNRKTLSMCQDVTLNTAEGKSMMYAICWNTAGTRMVQVGIEPVRLLEELRSNQISEVVQNMPSSEGLDIVVADRGNWSIVASTRGIRQSKLEPTTANVEVAPDRVTQFYVDLGDDGINICSASAYEDYIIAIVQDRAEINANVPLAIAISFAYLVFAAAILFNVFKYLTGQIIEEQQNANTDPMTGLNSRRAYETALDKYRETPPGERFVYVSMDLNGLKTTNDTMGHEMGDRLIDAAAKCMSECFGKYGRVYRIGGDEFVALIFDDDEHVDEVRNDFERALRTESREQNIEVSVTSSFVKRSEFPDMTIDQIAKIADERLYEGKKEYYRTHDRRSRRR